ncbi:VWA-like domain-containing protein [Adlercreutzia sp. ZJ138]|uniref:vWA domain-containing protein n=1 Tax=Adlercreutzia sp. ZJ138 TaxID=2709405 RepID=UPI0013EB9497|nr:VWA-like domain-containing protein [Adlercreutzia sp. ZJ138]
MPQINLTEKDELALRVINLAKALVLADNHFLSAAVGRLHVTPSFLDDPFATDGFSLAFDAERVLRAFRSLRAAPKHDLLHSVMHCVFLHPYVGPSVDQPLWDLASDIAAERAAAKLCGPRPGMRGVEIADALERIERELGGHVTAEKAYGRLRAGQWYSYVEKWASLFHSDAHGIWYVPLGAGDVDGNDSADSNPSDGDGQHTNDSDSDGANAPGCSNTNTENNPSHDDGSASGHTLARPLTERQKQEWRHVAASLSVNLQTMSRTRGEQLSGFSEELMTISREKIDYAAFLRQFATPGEVMRLSDDEFDYIFYTFGLKLYGDLPLIEPLESREEKRIREFVIVIDTSGSVYGEAVRRFMGTTVDILQSTELFFDQVNIHIIQCDADVVSDDVVITLDDLTKWEYAATVRGGGGTDFRPAFEYVDTLLEDGAFENLGGLIYFTDGWGIYPEHMPAYRTAFVFYDDDHRPEDVPPWAVQIVLGNEDINHLTPPSA